MVRDAATEAGRPIPELQTTVYHTRIGAAATAKPARPSSFAAALRADQRALADSPAVLIGSVEQCVELLLERRERYGTSAWHLGSDLETVAPIVARLAGR